MGLGNDKRYSRFHDLFRRAKWSSFKASKLLFSAILKEWLVGESIQIVIDTTLERRRGPKILGLGVHRDAVGSTKRKKAFSTGHNWLVACVLIRFPGTNLRWSLPFLSILLRPEHVLSSSTNRFEHTHKRPHKKITKYTSQIVHVLRRWVGSNREIILAADSAFCCREICRTCQRRNVIFCSRLRLDASLYDFPPTHNGKKGRPRVAGRRLPNLQEVANDPGTNWEKFKMEWYGGKEKTVEIYSRKCLWYHNTSKPVPIRWVLTRDPVTGEVAGILCTDPETKETDAIKYFIRRWSIETTFQEVRRHLKFETLRTWSDQGIERVSPALMCSYSIICLIASQALKDNKEDLNPIQSAWYQKNHVTFSDVHAYVKLLIINGFIFTQSSKNVRVCKNKIYVFLYRAVVG